MRITHLVLIGILISLAAATAPSKTDNSHKKSKPTERPAISTTKTTAKPTKSTVTNTTTRSSKSLKSLKTGENRGKRTLYDFNNPSFLYPQIAARRAGYSPDSRSTYSAQAGYFNGQNAIAQFPSDYYQNYAPYPQYLEAPEPIIEIIIKDANETLPEANAQPVVTKTKKKKEKVHVFYVNYKKDHNNKLHLESPIASLNNDDADDEEEEEEEIVQYPVTPLPPVKSTTLRTIIHPDSEKYHSNSGIHVTFGTEDKSQKGHILEEHDAESVQRQVVAVPVAQTGVKSQFQLNARNDFQGQARSPFTSNFFQSSAPWQYQGQQQQQQQQQQQYHSQTQQQLPHHHSSNYFKAPTHQQHSTSQHHSNNQFYQKQPFHQQATQQKSQYSSHPPAPTPTPLPPVQRVPLNQIHQQLQQQSQYYVNHNQVYQQSSQQQQQQQPQQRPSSPQQHQQSKVQHNQYYNTITPKPNQTSKSSIIFPTAPPKTQELPLRHAQQPYQPIKFRPTSAPAVVQQPKPAPIAAKLENTQYSTNVKYPTVFQKQPQFIQHPTFTISYPTLAPSTLSYKTQPQQLQQQQYQNHYQAQTQTQPQQQQPQISSLYYSQNKYQQQQQHSQTQIQPQQNTRYQTQSPNQQHTSSSLPTDNLSWLNIKPSKETELLKSIPKFEQHITETVQNHYNPNQYQTQSQVIHDIPAPNLAPLQQQHEQQPQSQALQGHYITASALTGQPQHNTQTFSNFVTTSSNVQYDQQVPSTTQAPVFSEATDGQKIMIVTPMPPNVYQQYQAAHAYQNSQTPSSHQQTSTQIINSIQPSLEQYHQYYQQPRQGQSNTQASSSPYSVSNYHSDVFKELEQRNSQNQESQSSQNAYIPPQETASTTTATSTSSSSTTVNPKTLLQLPAEVPDDLRQQLLSSGILGNADISVLDYDKEGDIALENLPAEHLQHFYGAGGGAQISESKKVLTVLKPNGDKISLDEKEIERVKQANSVPHNKQTDVKLVRFHGQKLENPEAASTSGERQYNRYLPLKINGANFPKPGTEELQAKSVQSVVVLAPVDTLVGQDGVVVEDSKEVKFLGGDLIKTLVKKPTKENFKRWLEKEARTDVEQQSVVLLVAKSSNSAEQEIFMYDITTGEVNKLNGELSSKFVSVAEENASTEDLEYGSTLDPNYMETMMKPTTKS